MEDYITVLRTASLSGAPPGIVTKVYPSPKGKTPKPKYFTSRRVPISSIEDIHVLIKSVQDDPRTCIIAGCKREGAPEIHRRKASGGEKENHCEDKLRCWVMVDIDDFPIARVGCTAADLPQSVILKFIFTYLPAIYHDVTFVCQLSASCGQKKSNEPLISAHLFYMLDRMCSNEELKAHFGLLRTSAQIVHYQENNTNLFDLSLYNSVQEHFIAAPILLEGAAMPPAERVWLWPLRDDVVRISEWLDPHEDVYNEHLQQVGDDRKSFHEPLLKGIYHHVRQFGAPEYEARERLKEICREAIDRAAERPQGVRPGRDDLNRYRSDGYLDQSIDGAIERAPRRGRPLDPRQIEEAAGRFVYVQSRRQFYDTHTGHYSDPEDMRVMLGLEKNPTRSPAFLAALQRVDYVRAVPGQAQGFVQEDRPVGGHWRVWNTWPGRLVEPTFGDATWFVHHVEQKICGGNMTAAAHVLDWIAHAIARPGIKIMHALILGEPERGTGKSALKRLLSKIIPDVKPLSNNDLKEKFRGYVPGTELAFAEEIRLVNDIDAANSLKELITESPISARLFKVGTEWVNNYMNIMGSTNFRDALHVHERDRRIFFFYYDGPPDTKEYYDQLHWNIDNRASDVLGWALKRDLSKFNIYEPPPITEHAREMARLSRSSEAQNVQNAVEERAFPFTYAVNIASDMRDKVNEHFKARFSDAQLKAVIDRVEGVHWVAERRYKNPEVRSGWSTVSFIVFDEERLNLQNMSGTGLHARVGRKRSELLSMAGLSPAEIAEMLAREEGAAAEPDDSARGMGPETPY